MVTTSEIIWKWSCKILYKYLDIKLQLSVFIILVRGDQYVHNGVLHTSDLNSSCVNTLCKNETFPLHRQPVSQNCLQNT
jgi:hypothetical protein